MDNSKTIFRIIKDKENPYVMINKQFLYDKRLSWKAKGILTYLLSMPDDWQIYETELVKHSKDGLTSLKSGIKELIELGYIIREQIRNEKGQFKGYEYCVYEIPAESGKPINGDSINGEPHTTNNNITDNDLTKKERYMRQDVNNFQTNKSKKDSCTVIKEDTPLDIDKEALEFLELMPSRDCVASNFIKIYRKVRKKYSREELERCVDRYKECKKLKSQHILHNPDNFFRYKEYERYLDKNWDITLEEAKKQVEMTKDKKKQFYYKNKTGPVEPQVTEEWEKQLKDLGW